jgi:hypothetical protein
MGRYAMSVFKKSILFLLFILISLTGAGCMNSEEKVLNYLEEKYNQEFEIEGYDKGSLFFSQMYGGDTATVHLKENPEIVFLVEEDSDDNGVYYDNYILAKWAEELKKKLAEDIEKELPQGSQYKICVYVSAEKYDSSMQDMSFDEYLNEVTQDIRISLIAGIKMTDQPDINQFNLPIYNLFQIMKSVGTERYAISVGFVDKSEDITDYIRTSYVNNIDWSNYKAKVFGAITISDRHDPEKPDESSMDPSRKITGPDRIEQHYQALED